jgi:formate/nitrite transporter FocA (FNT family)
MMNEFLRDMLAVTLGVIIGGLVLMAIYDYYYNVHLASTAVGG